MSASPKLAAAMLAATALALVAPPGHGQSGETFPSRPIRIVVAFSAGGTPDTLARMVGPKMSESFGQPVVIDNRPGAGGTIAAALVAKAPADGYTLLATSPGFAVTAALQPGLPYDPLKDLVGVAPLGYNLNVLVVSPASGVKSVKELIALARAQPGKVFFGSAGTGSATHMNGERFRLAAGIKVQHVAFKGQPEFLIEIAAGRIHYGVAGMGPALTLIKDGKLLALAVVSPARTKVLPEVPTAAEVLPGWDRTGTQVWLAPARTPRAVVNRINREVARILELPDIRQRLESYDFQVVTSTPEELDRMLRADIEVFARIAKEAGLRPQ
jgi:tripartite-type tricarboxylate transporter receptor subunit TctC